jgi:Flp pilus assembly protein TadD
MAARLLVLGAALAAIAFFAVQEHAARGADTVSKLSLRPTRTPDAAELRRSQALVRRARRVSPDTQPSVDLAILQGRAGGFRAAGSTAQGVLAQEPENIRAWAVLSLVARRYDSDLAGRARARVLALAPPVPPAR